MRILDGSTRDSQISIISVEKNMVRDKYCEFVTFPLNPLTSWAKVGLGPSNLSKRGAGNKERIAPTTLN